MGSTVDAARVTRTCTARPAPQNDEGARPTTQSENSAHTGA